MKRVRIGNDIKVTVPLTVSGSATSLLDIADFHVYVKQSYGKVLSNTGDFRSLQEIPCTIDTTNNKLIALWNADVQNAVGQYDIIISATTLSGANAITDKSYAVELVDRCELQDTEVVTGNVAVVVELTALTLSFAGMSAYELAVSKGYEGTLEEWLDEVRGGGVSLQAEITARQEADTALLTNINTRSLKSNTYTKSEVDNALQTLDDDLNGKIDLKQADIKATEVYDVDTVSELNSSTLIVVTDGNAIYATILSVTDSSSTKGILYQYGDGWRIVTEDVEYSGLTWGDLLSAFGNHSRDLTEKGMSDEQAAQLQKLMNKTFPLTASASILPTGLQEKGITKDVTIYSIKAFVDGVEQARTATYINNTEIDGDSKTFNNVGETTNYAVKVKIGDGREATVGKTVTFVYPTYSGFGEDANSIVGSNKQIIASAKGTYAATNSTGNTAKFFILVPSGVAAPTTFTMGGAPYVMTKTTQTLSDGRTYSVFTSGSNYANGGTVNIVAS